MIGQQVSGSGEVSKKTESQKLPMSKDQAPPATTRCRRLKKPEAQSSTSAPVATETGINVLKLNSSSVDGMLNLLHKMLLEQMEEKRLLRAALTIEKPLDESLSGAKAVSVRRAHPEQRRARAKPDPSRVATSRALERLESLLKMAQRSGIGTSSAERHAAAAREEFLAGSYRDSKGSVAKATEELEGLAAKQLSVNFEGLKQRIRQLGQVSSKLTSTRQAEKRAETAIANHRWIEAIEATDALGTLVKGAERGVILDLVCAARPCFVKAGRLGLNVDGPTNLLKESRVKLASGDIAGAVRCVQNGKKSVEGLLARHEELVSAISEYSRALVLAESLDIDTGSVRRRFVEAKGHGDARVPVRRLVAELGQAVHDKVEGSLKLAEKALADAQAAGADISVPEETLRRGREALARNRFIDCIVLSGSGMLQANAAMLQLLTERAKSIEQFASGVGGEVESMTEVQEALAHSKGRSLEEFRRQTALSERIVSQAFDSAIAYTKVSQDIVREAFESAVSIDPGFANGITPGRSREPALSIEDRKLRIEDLHQSGRITESQRDRLLAVIELSESRADLV